MTEVTQNLETGAVGQAEPTGARNHTVALMTSVSSNARVSSVVRDDQGDHWTILLDDGAPVEATLDADDDAISFSVVVAAPEQGLTATSHEFLLRLNFLSRSNGGLHAALDEDGQPVLIVRQRTTKLDATTLLNLLENLARYAEAWSIVLSNDDPDDADFEEVLDTSAMQIIRG